MIIRFIRWLNGISATCARFDQTNRIRAVDSLILQTNYLAYKLRAQQVQLSQILEEKKCTCDISERSAFVYSDEIHFTLDRYLYLTDDPCRVCRDTLKSGNENPCVDCVDLKWVYGDPLPEHFELHEDLK